MHPGCAFPSLPLQPTQPRGRTMGPSPYPPDTTAYFSDDRPVGEYSASRKGATMDPKPPRKFFSRRRHDSHAATGLSVQEESPPPPTQCSDCYYCQFCDPAPPAARDNHEAYRLCQQHQYSTMRFNYYGHNGHFCSSGVSIACGPLPCSANAHLASNRQPLLFPSAIWAGRRAL